ncbi:MAG TPA: hypothetical protein VJ798_13205 [Rhizomicrobium sp.]|nr:hypothetical protein [Rhizomicrobium sp.]
MRTAPSWKDKLPSIAGTLAMQAAFAALLLFSITAVRRELAQPETILFLPPSRPVTIDARQPRPLRDRPQQPAAQAAPMPPPLLPAYAAPSAGLSASTGGNGALLGALGRYVENCRIERRDADASCPPSKLAHRDERTLALDERKQVKNAPVWQAEVDRRNAPFALPGAGAGPLGILITALVNPSAFSDPKAYSAVSPPPVRVSGAEALQQRRYNNPSTSLNGTDYENRIRMDSATGAMHVGGP